MSMSFAVTAIEACDYIKAYDKARTAVTGEHQMNISMHAESNVWYVEIDTDTHRTFLELCANLYAELPSGEAATLPVPENEDDAVLNAGFPVPEEIQGSDENWPGAAIGEGVGEDDEDDSEEFEDDTEEEDEDEEVESDDDEEEEQQDASQNDASQNDRIVKLKKPNFTQPTGNKHITVTG